MDDSLRQLRDSIEVPPIDPARERALLEAYDNRAATRPIARWPWLAAAAAVTLGTASFVWMAANTQPVAPLIAPPPAQVTGFVPWPGAHALPPFESGEVRRVELPVSALPALGLPEPPVPASVVTADVLIGRDGFARAVRLVPSAQSVQ